MRPISSHYHKGGPTVTIVRSLEMRSIGIASPHGHYPSSAPIPTPHAYLFPERYCCPRLIKMAGGLLRGHLWPLNSFPKFMKPKRLLSGRITI
jgi:hypothetical protein